MYRNSEEAFKAYFGEAKNFTTPKILKYHTTRNGLYIELSTGEFAGSIMFGVTVLEWQEGKIERRFDLSKCCDTCKEANAYIKSLS